MTADTTSADNLRPAGFAAGGEIYVFHPQATQNEVINQLNARLLQLRSLLQFTFGELREGFDSMSDEVRDNYMWGCSMLADECYGLVNHLALTRGDRQD